MHFRPCVDPTDDVKRARWADGSSPQTLIDLEDSHTYFIPPERSFTTEYGWHMQMIGQKCYVVAVKPGSDAEAKGLKEGDEIFSIDGFGPARANLWKINYFYQALRPRQGVRLVVIKPDGRELQLDVISKITQGKRVFDLTASGSGTDIFDLIRQQENEERLHRHRYIEVGEDLMIWKMPAFDLEESKVDEMLGKVKKRKSLILDMRGNGGGYEATLLRMVSNVFDRDIGLRSLRQNLIRFCLTRLPWQESRFHPRRRAAFFRLKGESSFFSEARTKW